MKRISPHAPREGLPGGAAPSQASRPPEPPSTLSPSLCRGSLPPGTAQGKGTLAPAPAADAASEKGRQRSKFREQSSPKNGGRPAAYGGGEAPGLPGRKLRPFPWDPSRGMGGGGCGGMGGSGSPRRFSPRNDGGEGNPRDPPDSAEAQGQPPVQSGFCRQVSAVPKAWPPPAKRRRHSGRRSQHGIGDWSDRHSVRTPARTSLF